MELSSGWIAAVLALPFVLSLTAFPFGAARTKFWAVVCGALSLAGALALFLVFQGAESPNYPRFDYAWWEVFGATLSLRLDGLALIMSLLILGIGGMLFTYAGGYLNGRKDAHRIVGFLLAFQGAMLGLVLSDNLITLFVFWELTSITSYLLIGTEHGDARSRRNALQALLITGLGGIAMLGGFIIIAESTGIGYQLSDWLADPEAVISGPYTTGALILILLGAFTKSAQFPFHIWLPNAMVAPTPISAYLHSATMVKAGVFLLARLQPVFGDIPLWETSLVTLGAITFLMAAFFGLRQTDLKKILAYTTLSVLGLLTLLIGVGTDLALKSAILFLTGHALYKAALFMTAGGVDHAVHSRDLRRLGGLRKAMPLTMAAAGLAALSKAGFPPFFGFVGKEYTYKAGYSGGDWGFIFLTIAIVGNAILFALAWKAGVHPFWGKTRDKELTEHAHEGGWQLWFPPLALAVTGLILGMFPGLLAGPLVFPATMATVGEAVDSKLALWHGFSVPLLLSALTLALGLTLYRLRERFWPEPTTGPARDSMGDRVYDFLFGGLMSIARGQTQALQSGQLRSYLVIVLGTTIGLLLYQFYRYGIWTSGLELTPVAPTVIGLTVLMILASIFVCFTKSRMAAIVALGVIGFGLASIFAWYGAPDVAITQILVETLTVLLFVIVILRLPALRNLSKKRTRVFDAALASVAGITFGLLALKAINLELGAAVSEQLANWSYIEAKGRNVVNVILVDFRAIDTFGEIIVLGIAALGVAAICRFERDDDSAISDSQFRNNRLLQTAAKVLVPLALILSVIILWRGHNLPGGGFIGGLVAACGILFYRMVQPQIVRSAAWRRATTFLIAVGLAVALMSGLHGLAWGGAFMEGAWAPTFALPLLGTIHLGTPLLFDVGVFLTVIGFTLKTVFALTREEEIRWS